MPLQKNNINQLVDHLYRHESGKLIAVLTSVLGAANLDLVEDVVQDSLIEAMKTWPYNGVPRDPSAWLYKVAKNKALNILRKEKYKHQYSSQVLYLPHDSTTDNSFPDDLISGQLADDQLRMIFTCCHPLLSKDSQVALTLKTLCGFSIPEIARAFFTTEDTINKRLVRARQKIREANIPFEVPGTKEMEERLEAVLETIYLVFNEGYSASSGDEVIRHDLCEEAIRLAEMISSYPGIQNKSNVYAVLSLMLLNASRFRSRIGEEGNILTLAEQDRSLWSQQLIEKGFSHLERATEGNILSTYHLMAAISACHCAAPEFAVTDWKLILGMYDRLLLLDPSPVVRLNRCIPLAKLEGPQKGVEELQMIRNDPSFDSYHLLFATEAEFYLQLKQFEKAAASLELAIEHSPLKAEKMLLQKKLEQSLAKIS
ncbi:MAG: RNA polymerase sigma factor [Flavisolibacter sp.]